MTKIMYIVYVLDLTSFCLCVCACVLFHSYHTFYCKVKSEDPPQHVAGKSVELRKRSIKQAPSGQQEKRREKNHG